MASAERSSESAHTRIEGADEGHGNGLRELSIFSFFSRWVCMREKGTSNLTLIASAGTTPIQLLVFSFLVFLCFSLFFVVLSFFPCFLCFPLISVVFRCLSLSFFVFSLVFFFFFF